MYNLRQERERSVLIVRNLEDDCGDATLGVGHERAE
jgi:hypothetical protein